MGITIHYHGKAKNKHAIDELISLYSEIAETSGWKYRIEQKVVKGEYRPFWGNGFAYVPSAEEVKKRGIEFFPAMVTARCNGYFKLFDSKFREKVRASLRKGTRPRFSIDTEQKGIHIDLHPKCETLSFVFDLKTLELAHYYTVNGELNVVYGTEGLSCKTQFAGMDVHILVCKLIRAASKYIDYSRITDECGFYHSEEIEDAQRVFNDLGRRIQDLARYFREKGVTVRTGADI